jgi:hypothetical protein
MLTEVSPIWFQLNVDCAVMRGAFSTVLIVLVLASHSFLSFADFFGGLPTADFLARDAGVCSDPTKLTPLEATFVTLVGLPHFVIVLLFLSALASPAFGISLRGAAFASFLVHGVWSAHLLVRKQQWSGIFCTSEAKAVDWRFFIGAHALWTVVSLILVILLRSSDGTTPKKKAN